MFKKKNRKSFLKRFRVKFNKNVKRACSFKNHILYKKSSKSKRNLKKKYLSKPDVKSNSKILFS